MAPTISRDLNNIVLKKIFICFMCLYVWMCMGESGGLAISLADSRHLAEGFEDRQSLNTITLHAMSQMPLPLTRVPLHTGRGTLRWMRNDRHGCLAWMRKSKWARGGYKKITVVIWPNQADTCHYLLGKGPNQYLVTDKACRFDVCCCSLLRLVAHSRSWGVYRNISCDGVKQELIVTKADGCSSHIFMSDSVLFLMDENLLTTV